MIKNIGIPGDQYGTGGKFITKTNRTGGDTAIGGVYMIDAAQADAASTTINLGLDGLLKPTTAGLSATPMVIATEVKADDKRVLVAEGEKIRVKILVEGTTDVAKGDILTPVNGQVYMVKGAVNRRYYAIALEAQTSATPTPIDCLFWSDGKLTPDTALT